MDSRCGRGDKNSLAALYGCLGRSNGLDRRRKGKRCDGVSVLAGLRSSILCRSDGSIDCRLPIECVELVVLGCLQGADGCRLRGCAIWNRFSCGDFRGKDSAPTTPREAGGALTRPPLPITRAQKCSFCFSIFFFFFFTPSCKPFACNKSLLHYVLQHPAKC